MKLFMWAVGCGLVLGMVHWMLGLIRYHSEHDAIISGIQGFITGAVIGAIAWRAGKKNSN